jgi:DNA-binding NtrC family response regulator
MNRTRILLVHPEASGLALLASMLRPLGHELIEALSARDTHPRLSIRPELVLIAVDPTEPLTRELLSDIRRDYPRTPIIVLATAACTERSRPFINIGATSVLRFPLPASQLQAAVVQALGSTAVRAIPMDEPSARPGRQPPHPERRPTQIEDSSPDRVGPVPDADAGDPARGIQPLKVAMEGPEREIILQALEACEWNRRETAKALDISRSTLYHKMKSYGLLVEEGDLRPPKTA